jgi:hypothetical protein
MAEIMRLMVIELTRHVVPGFQFGAPGGKGDLGKAQEDDAEESLRTATIEIRFGRMGRRR